MTTSEIKISRKPVLKFVKVYKVYKCKECEHQVEKSTTLSLGSSIMCNNYKVQNFFRCKECKLRFSQKHTLYVHKRKHSQSKPYMCIHCNKTFITRSGLILHRKAHAIEATYTDKAFEFTKVSNQSNDMENRLHHEKAFPACTHMKQLLKMMDKEKMTETNLTKCSNTEKTLSSQHILFGGNSVSSKSTVSQISNASELASECPMTVVQKKDKNINITDPSVISLSGGSGFVVNIVIGDKSKCVMLTPDESSLSCVTNPQNLINTVPNSYSLPTCVKSHETGSYCTFKCKHCSQSFDCMEKLHEHKKSHKKKQQAMVPCPWPHCKKKLTSRKRLDSHLKRHNGGTFYLCHRCGMQFNDCVFYHKHKGVCLPKFRTYACSICNKELSGYSALQKHTRIHTGEKPCQCEICGSRFNNTSHLTRHKRIHIRKGEIPDPNSTFKLTDKTESIRCQSA